MKDECLFICLFMYGSRNVADSSDTVCGRVSMFVINCDRLNSLEYRNPLSM